MKEIKNNIQKSIDVPAGANRVTVEHEWGNIIVANLVVSTTYNFTPDSIGIHSFIFSNGNATITYPVTQDGREIPINPTITGDIKATITYEVVDLYVTQSEFFSDNDDLDIGDNSDNFTKSERKIRRIINVFTRQIFGPYVNKTRRLQGDGGNSLIVPVRLTHLISCVDNFGFDMTPLVEIAPDLMDWIQRKPNVSPFSIRPLGMLYDIDIKADITRDTREFFSSSMDFTIVGNWGWKWIPNNVTEAAKLLLIDEYNGTNEDINSWITAKKLDEFGVSYNSKLATINTTGNINADSLLSDFINIELGLA